jgi:hypothetical protein
VYQFAILRGFAILTIRQELRGTILDWPPYDNIAGGKNDCSVVAAAHLIGLWTGSFPTLAEVDAAYSAITGGKNQDVSELVALDYWRDVGIGGHRIKSWKLFPHRDTPAVKAAIEKPGLYVCVNLPLSVSNSPTWVPADGPREGHFIAAPLLAKAGPVGITWGHTQPMTWEFWHNCVETAVLCVQEG